MSDISGDSSTFDQVSINSSRTRNVPLLFKCLPTNYSSKTFKTCYKYYILIITFLAYTCYHCSRKPITVVKAELHHNCSQDHSQPHPDNSSTWCDWKPFDQDNYKVLFGELDYAFLGAYALSMFFSGWVAERVSLRHFLTVGMILSGIFTAAFGMGYVFKIHFFGYYLLAQILNGIVQATGWPGVVTLVGNWFGKGRRGLIMGVWNSHTSIGNIIGSLIAASFATSDWALSFLIPGAMIGFIGIVVFLTVVPNPKDLGIRISENDSQVVVTVDDEEEDFQSGNDEFLDIDADDEPLVENEGNAISFFNALCIPGVVEFSFCLFFAKLVSYTFLFWLPYYLSQAQSMNAKESGDYSTLFDVGGIIGGIIAGILSDKTGNSATTVAFMLTFGCGALFMFQIFSHVNLVLSLMFTGLLVNGPYALITTAVSADLGTHPSLQGNSAALATVTSIIDGTGSLGAALGPYLVGLISSGHDWSAIFKMLLVCNVLALLCLLRLVKKELF